MPEDEIEAVQELPYLVDLKASEKADLKVCTSGLFFASGRASICANPACPREHTMQTLIESSVFQHMDFHAFHCSDGCHLVVTWVINYAGMSGFVFLLYF